MSNHQFSALEKIGVTPWFSEQADDTLPEPFQFARVTSVHKEACTISNGDVSIQAEITGKLMFTADSPLDYPAVGDWVTAQFLDDDTFAIIHDILPRQTTLIRKTPGKKIDHQLIAANIDTALVMQALDSDFSLRRLERYLAIVNEGGIHPAVLLGKRDLLPPEDIKEKVNLIQNTYPGLTVATLSNVEERGLDEVSQLLFPGKTYCLLGSSGIGKTTLLNKLLGSEEFKTAAVREKDSKGRHTTTHRQLVRLENGALIVDTPGMRELGFVSLETGIQETFTEIELMTANCRYRDCTHTREDGCAVLIAVESGEIPADRYQNYIKMQKESAFHEMSYIEKRQKSKQFGKMVKNILKEKNKE